jgi:hypothetical protein
MFIADQHFHSLMGVAMFIATHHFHSLMEVAKIIVSKHFAWGIDVPRKTLLIS